MQGVADILFADLRISLLVIGVLFITILIVWELVQRRRAKRADDAHERGPLGQSRDADDAPVDPLLDRESESEPGLTLPEMTVRDRLVEPRIVDLAVAVDTTQGSRSLPIVDAVTLSDTDVDVSMGEGMRAASEPLGAQTSPESAATVADEANRSPRAPWPPETERRIVGLRVVARAGERFTGASLRQALQGEGFEHGDMDIFHRSTAEGRVLLSAASLTRPGSFDLATMDSNLYLGLNLFAILPGPLPARDTVDRLLTTGHTLAKRLRGELQGSQGEALTETRLAEMRREAARGEG